MSFLKDFQTEVKVLVGVLVIAILIVGGFFLFLNISQQQAEQLPQQTISPQIEETVAVLNINLQTTKFATISEGFENLYSVGIAFSPDGRQVAYREKDGEKAFMVLNGEEGKRYDEIWRPTFSSDGKQFAYEAKENGKEFIVLNGEEGTRYDYIGFLTFSPDGNQFAYYGDDRDRESDKQEFIVLNGDELKGYRNIQNLTFSPDGSQFAYIAERHDDVQDEYSTFIVLNGEEEKGYDDILDFDMYFSPDGEHFVYIGVEETPRSEGGEYWVDEEYFVVLDEIEGEGYDDVNGLTFSPNGEQLVYVAEESPPGEQTEYFVVVNGEEGKRSEKFPNLIFNSDGEFTFIEINDYEFTVKTGTGETERNSFVERIIYSPDDKQAAYLTRYGLTHFVFLDGKQVHRSPNSIRHIKFSPDGKHLVFVDRWGEKYGVILDGKTGQRYDVITEPVFSTDSKYIAYGVRDGNELWWIVEEINSRL